MAQQWGYPGELGSRDMNIWLIKQIKKRIRDGGGIDKFIVDFGNSLKNAT
jgi:hypothetical protein